jgi:hypothetical protein
MLVQIQPATSNAIVVAVYGTYRVLGNNIGSLASGVDSTLTNA